MLGKVDLVNYEKCYPKRLKKIFQLNINMATYDEFVPYMKNQIVGNIPVEIIKLFKNDKAKNIKMFQNALANISKYLRSQNRTRHDATFYGNSIVDFNSSISKMFNNCIRHVVPQGVRGELSYVGKGAYGNVYKLSMFNENGEKIMHDKALKVYNSIECPYGEVSSIQNNYAEANFWIFIKNAMGHSLDKTQFTKHFISDLKSGYSLTEFIDDSIPKTTSPVNLKDLFNINYIDLDNNLSINSKVYDVGGMKKLKLFTSDKVTLRYLKKLHYSNSKKEQQKLLQNLKYLISNPKTPHRDKIAKSIELFEQKQNVNNYVI